MTRKKVKLAFIVNDSARKATYKKRKRGLLKKMDELTTLCDVKACAIMYSPYEVRPVVWPGPSGAREVISSFKRLPEMEKVKKMVSQEEFLRQRITKAHEQLKRQQKENREKEMTQIMYQCLSGGYDLTHAQMMAQPWPSFMDMLNSTINHDPHHQLHPHHGMGMGMSGGNGGASSSNNNSNMNMMMMMGQFGDYHGHGVNPSLWSNNYYP
ncbi:unnamed protein product [Amaranthus hypochondriacus]